MHKHLSLRVDLKKINDRLYQRYNILYYGDATLHVNI